ncbi:dol-P-Man:Man(5)GlcNAc(2)-PP-Dol alpha-1,3-mannosyltransferase-like protein [Polychytrium aggregatum]|uniref:dol-P-Man:Man(5)GlcNAc(2)-PP-Dol alpha-1,3-mannosyltransferase-like protein n=1 Tax=Polychytrium aggregatum TaxID=110093 RepID=UPI0022FEA2A1|nr:dol-P-Man:Man(5)GlcNAc(2)-PP-Dol alpha-1,3-mannosyltransferase-like protein [Polychytrium aggregatum]KAI9206369.1 dol-P-Man:Man(5)GlcNAc(2)-PP-Dol alpha-1,3-mannosyltransferase-like protein [Polychytrium aggregatum]
MPPSKPASQAPVPVLRQAAELAKRIALDWSYFYVLAIPLLLFEALLTAAIILKIPYTEIDWIAYIQEVGGFLGGEYDYYKLAGDTGPLVYPAGFVYVYSLLFKATSSGEDIQTAQHIFAILYLVSVILVLMIYRESRVVPPFAAVFLVLSRRLHSIYVLRLFNDPVAMIPLYLCVLALLRGRWMLSAVLFSLGVSVKMNVLLFAPGFALIIYQAVGLANSVLLATMAIAIQAALAIPFLLHEPQHYLARAFEFSRVFMYKWTVNWKIVDEDTFLRKDWAALLLGLHLVLLVLFGITNWTRSYGGIFNVIAKGLRHTDAKAVLTSDHIIFVMFTSNFIGIVFARSLHYQFYSWYYFTLPYLLWRGRIPTVVRIVTLGAIEYCWNVYPATKLSSSILLAAHALLLASLLAVRSSDGEFAPATHSKRD